MRTDLTDQALLLARAEVESLRRHECTVERFEQIAAEIAQVLSAAGRVDVIRLVHMLEVEFNVYTPPAVVVTDPSEHVDWLDSRRDSIDFSYWQRYETWLRRSGRKPGALTALDESTDQVLSRLEDPRRPGPWETHGMVFGQVQSGKTANYTGNICKAVDAGYRVIIVLTSQHESLRHQTQARLDHEFLGFNTRFTRDPNTGNSKWVGVGTLNLKDPPVRVQAITTQDGDFTTAQFRGASVDINQTAVLAVVKKNARILRNLRDWLRNLTPSGSDTIPNAPVLLIDDEADYGSVDTNRPRSGSQSDPEHDPTAINTCVRELLGVFDQSAYVAYTATPFANIFIDGDTDHDTYGRDLFPRNFIIALEPPSDYCGPEVVFGLRDDESVVETKAPLPTIRAVEDHTSWLPDGHKKGFSPGSVLPPSLVEALDAFVLSTAVRRRREDSENRGLSHNTMLVHVTRLTDVQGEVARQIEDHLRTMAETWGDHGMAGRALRWRLRDLWVRDFEATWEQMAERDDVGSQIGARVAWEDIGPRVAPVLEDAAAGVRRINGTAADVLEYEHAEPATIVAVGGDKLSRGLTLEGLTVSYYLRASRAYDTLLQMGRWFGYRPGYLDVTRLYTTNALLSSYVHITRANRDLMDLTATVARSGLTPKDVGLRVLEGTGSLSVTAAAKMRSSTALTVSLAGEMASTLHLLTDERSQKQNLAALDTLFTRIMSRRVGPADVRLHGKNRGGLTALDVPVEVVREFLQSFSPSHRLLTSAPENLLDYVEAQNSRDELTHWTVAVAGGRSRSSVRWDNEINIPMVRRNKVVQQGDGECELNILVGPEHEELGLSKEQLSQAEEATRQAFLSEDVVAPPKRARARLMRQQRSPKEGLLIVYPIDPATSGIEVANPEAPVIGYVVSFPNSPNAKRINYRVNKKYLEELRRAVTNDEDET